MGFKLRKESYKKIEEYNCLLIYKYMIFSSFNPSLIPAKKLKEKIIENNKIIKHKNLRTKFITMQKILQSQRIIIFILITITLSQIFVYRSLHSLV